MSNMDFDAIENNKFWQNIVRYGILGVVGVVLLWNIADAYERDRMVAAGYEYRRVVAQRTVSYTYQWVKIGSPESREEVSDTVPESKQP